MLPTGTSTVLAAIAGGFGNDAAVGFDQRHLKAVQMDRMMIHRAEVAEADAHALAELGDQRLQCRDKPCCSWSGY